jgi:hypothetical protein
MWKCNTLADKIHLASLLCPLLFWLACTQTENKKQTEILQDSTKKLVLVPTDTLAEPVCDTSNLEKKRAFWISEYEGRMNGVDSTILIDLNYDGYQDLVIWFQGGSGTGLKNWTAVFIYDPRFNGYRKDSTLSSLPNASFYLSKHLITGFYIGLGAGNGSQVEWIKGNWITTKTFTVDSRNLEKAAWVVKYPLTGTQQTIWAPYAMIPPAKVLASRY